MLASTTNPSVPSALPADDGDDVRHRSTIGESIPSPIWWDRKLLILEERVEILFLDHVLRADLSSRKPPGTDPASDGFGVLADPPCGFRDRDHRTILLRSGGPSARRRLAPRPVRGHP